MLLGYPSGDPGNQSTVTVSSPFNAKVHYFGGYAQDDWRVSPKFTVNYGVRLEHETGLQREEQRHSRWPSTARLNPGGALGDVVGERPARARRSRLCRRRTAPTTTRATRRP